MQKREEDAGDWSAPTPENADNGNNGSIVTEA
jgi:hypothetical protein